jgi:hypothetical protein
MSQRRQENGHESGSVGTCRGVDVETLARQLLAVAARAPEPQPLAKRRGYSWRGWFTRNAREV